MLLRKVPDQFGEEPHVVDGHVGLKGVAHVPARLAPAVAFALRVADGETVAVGDLVHAETLRPGLSAVAVEDDDQRRPGRQSFGQVEAVRAVDAARPERVAGGLRAAGSRCEKQQAAEVLKDVFHGCRYLESFAGEAPGQRVVKPDHGAAPAGGQGVQGADLAQRAAVGPCPGEEPGGAGGLLCAAFGADY